MLTSFRNTLIGTPRKQSDQMFGSHPMILSSWHIKFTITEVYFHTITSVETGNYSPVVSFFFFLWNKYFSWLIWIMSYLHPTPWQCHWKETLISRPWISASKDPFCFKLQIPIKLVTLVYLLIYRFFLNGKYQNIKTQINAEINSCIC